MILNPRHLFLFACFLIATTLHLVAEPDKNDWEQKAKLKIDTFQVPQGMKVDLWADASQTKNPSHFTFDSKGRMYICEIDRWRRGVDDIRERPYMLLDDILINSSEDRMAMFRKHLDKHPMEWYTSVSDRIRLVEDRDGDGRADHALVYADNFKDALDGPGIGIIERDGIVYYTNIPNLWMLKDSNDDGVADERQVIQDGFGIRMSFSGHDMHGLIWGPDGKLYWSIGDRGFSIKTKEGKTFHHPNEGGVLRCDADGSNVEVFCRGLRNPQELAFDDEGNLFTADNDGDHGDLERISYIVEGGDYGWHAGHQAIMSFRDKYPLRSYSYVKEKRMMTDWLVSDMSLIDNGKQPAFQLPGVGQIEGGPSGFLYNSGRNMGDAYFQKYFVIHFRGSIARTNVTMFNMLENGAGFKTTNHELFFRGSNVVDLEIGPDGKMYFSEYNEGGWLNQNVGSIFAFYYPDQIAKPEIKQIAKILTSDFKTYSEDELYDFLSIEDLRVRQRAQFECAKRGSKGLAAFNKALASNDNVLRRLHGIWGISQMAYKEPNLLSTLLPYMNDPEAKVRIQTARVLGDHNYEKSIDALITALKDSHPRVAMYAAIGLGRMKVSKANDDLLALLERNNDQDRYLRHGAVMGLTGIGSLEALNAAKSHPSKAVRMGVLLCMRRLNNPSIAHFLNDRDTAIVDEAIRAINDVQIDGAQEALAQKIEAYFPSKTFEKQDTPIRELLQFRLVNANFYGGKKIHAERLLTYASNPDLSIRIRQEAIAALEAWFDETPLDTTTGMPRANTVARDDIKDVILAQLKKVFASAQGDLLAQVTRLAKNNDYPFGKEELLVQIKDTAIDASVRLESLKILEIKNPEALTPLLPELTLDKNFSIKTFALSQVLKNDLNQGIDTLKHWIEQDGLKEKQWSFSKLGELQDEKSKSILEHYFDEFLSQKCSPELHLDIITAARNRKESSLQNKVSNYDATLVGKPALERHHTELMGGDVNEGNNIFLNHGIAQCVRCHKVNGFGADVGPDLSVIGKEKSRTYLLESIVAPNANVAPGFGLMTLNLKSGESLAGLFMQDDPTNGIKLKMADGKAKFFKHTDIASKTDPISGMPPMELLLKPHEIRDLVAYLASLQVAQQGKKKNDTH